MWKSILKLVLNKRIVELNIDKIHFFPFVIDNFSIIIAEDEKNGVPRTYLRWKTFAMVLEWDLIKNVIQSFTQNQTVDNTTLSKTLLFFKFTNLYMHCPNLSYPMILNPGSNATNLPYSTIIEKCRNGSSKFTKSIASCFEMTFDVFELDLNLPTHQSRIKCSADTILICCDKNGSKLPNAILGINTIVNGQMDIYYNKIKAFSLNTPKCIMSCDYDLPSGCQDVKGELLTTTNIFVHSQSFLGFFKTYQLSEDNALEHKLALGLNSNGKMTSMTAIFEELDVRIKDDRSKTLYNEEEELHMHLISIKASLQTFMKTVNNQLFRYQDFNTNPDLHGDDITLSPNLRKIMTASVERISWNHAHYIEKIQGTISRDVFNEDNFVDKESFDLSFDDVCFDQLRPYFIDWLLILMEVSNSLPNSRFSHSKSQVQCLKVNKMIVGVIPEAMTIANELRYTTSSSSSSLESSLASCLSRIDKMVSFIFTNMHVAMTSVPNEPQVYTVNFDLFDIHTSLFSQSFQNEYGIDSYNCNVDSADRRIGSHWLFDAFSLKFKMTPTEMVFKSFTCKTFVIDMYTSSNSDVDCDISYRLVDCVTAVHDGVELPAISSTWDDCGNVNHHVGDMFIDLSIVRLLKILLYFEIINNSVNALIANMSRIKSLSPRDVRLHDQQKRLITNTNPVKTIRFIAKFDIRFCLIEYDAQYFQMNCVLREEVDIDSSDAIPRFLSITLSGMEYVTSNDYASYNIEDFNIYILEIPYRPIISISSLKLVTSNAPYEIPDNLVADDKRLVGMYKVYSIELGAMNIVLSTRLKQNYIFDLMQKQNNVYNDCMKYRHNYVINEHLALKNKYVVPPINHDDDVSYLYNMSFGSPEQSSYLSDSDHTLVHNDLVAEDDKESVSISVSTIDDDFKSICGKNIHDDYYKYIDNAADIDVSKFFVLKVFMKLFRVSFDGFEFERNINFNYVSESKEFIEDLHELSVQDVQMTLDAAFDSNLVDDIIDILDAGTDENNKSRPVLTYVNATGGDFKLLVGELQLKSKFLGSNSIALAGLAINGPLYSATISDDKIFKYNHDIILPDIVVNDATHNLFSDNYTHTLEISTAPSKIYSELVVDMEHFTLIIEQKTHIYNESRSAIISSCLPKDTSLENDEPATPLSWWDNCRYWLHGNITVKVNKLNFLYDLSQTKDFDIEDTSKVKMLQQANDIIILSSLSEFSMYVDSSKVELLASDIYVTADMSWENNNVVESDILNSENSRKGVMLALKRRDKSVKSRRKRRSFRIVHLSMEEVIARNEEFIQYIKQVESANKKIFQEERLFQSDDSNPIGRDGEYYSASKEFRRITKLCYIPAIVFGLHHKPYDESLKRSDHHDVYRNTPRRGENGKPSDKFENFRSLPFSAKWSVELLVKDMRHAMDERPLGIFIRLDVLKRILYSINRLSYQKKGHRADTHDAENDDDKNGSAVTLGNITQQIELQFELSRFIICSWKSYADPEGVVFYQNNMNMKMRLLRDPKRNFKPEYLHIKLENSEIYGRVWDVDVMEVSETDNLQSAEPIVSSEVIGLFTDRAKLSHASKVEIYLSKFGLKMDQEKFQSIGIINQKNLAESISDLVLQQVLEADDDANALLAVATSPVFVIGNDRRKTSNAVLRHDGKLSATETLRNSSITPNSNKKSTTPKIKKFHSEGYARNVAAGKTTTPDSSMTSDHVKLNLSRLNSPQTRSREYTPFIFFRNSFQANHEAFAPPLACLPKGSALRRRSTKMDKPNLSNENNDKSWNLKIEDFKLLWTIELYHLIYSYCIKHYEMHHPVGGEAEEDDNDDTPSGHMNSTSHKTVFGNRNSRKGGLNISTHDNKKDNRKKSVVHNSQDLNNKLLNLYNIKHRKSISGHKKVKLKEQEGGGKEAPRINYFDVTLINPQMNFLDTKTNSSLIMKTGEASLTGFKQANIIKCKSTKSISEKEEDPFVYKRRNEIQLKMDGVSAFTIKSKLNPLTYDPIIHWYDASGNNVDMRAAIQDFELNAFYSWYEDVDKNKIPSSKIPSEERDIELEYRFILDLPAITLDVSSQQYFILYNVAFNVLLAPPPSHLTKEQKNAAKGLRKQFATKDHIIQLPRPAVVSADKNETDEIRDIIKNYMVEGLSGFDLTAKKTVSMSIDEGKWILRDSKFQEIVETGFIGVNASFTFEMDKKTKIHAEIQRFWVIDNENMSSATSSSVKLPNAPVHPSVGSSRPCNGNNIQWVIKPFVDSTDKRFNFKCARCKEDFFIDVSDANKSVCTIHEDEYGVAGTIVNEESCNDLNQVITTEVWSCCRFPKNHAGCKSKPHKFERKMIELEVRRFPPVQIDNFPMDMNVIEYANIDIFKKDYNSNESGILESRITKDLYDSLNEYFNLSLNEESDGSAVSESKSTSEVSLPTTSRTFTSYISTFLKSESKSNTTISTRDADQTMESTKVAVTSHTPRKSISFSNHIDEDSIQNSTDYRRGSVHPGAVSRPRSVTAHYKDDDKADSTAVPRGSITISRPRGTTYYKDESAVETDASINKTTRSEGFYFKAFDIGEINASITVTGFVFGVGTTLKISKLMFIEKLFIRDASNREGGWNPLIGAIGSHALASLLTNAVNNATSAMYQFMITRPLQSMRVLKIGGGGRENDHQDNPEEQRKRALKLLGYDK